MRWRNSSWRHRVLAALLAAVAATTVAPVAQATAAPRPVPLVPAADREIRFTADGSTAYGTVHIPAHRAGHRLAAALLLPGSGLTDRDGDEPPAFTPHTLALFADTLGDDGVMSLRFDKYGTGRTGWGRYRNSDHIDLAAFTGQAVAAYDALRAQPEADPSAMLIVGHSEGGLQALLVDRAVPAKPAGLALIAPQDTRLLDAIDYQLAGQLDQAVAVGQLSVEQAALNKAGVRRAIADFRAHRPVDTSGLLPSIASFLGALFGPHNAVFVRSDDADYPPDIARSIAHRTRALVTCGTADTNVPCRTTPPLLAALASTRTTGPGLRVLPGIDHLLHPAGTPANDRSLAPAARRALYDFVRPWRQLTAS
ncbi:alpha/beta hydrolase family protein [Streptantibioticus rubrisoli]|uniref:Alpha/beta hydrolase n=1 Tax=Streptantibioticus rubrisoli TaxID=1387313 RepID=A0ABT1P9R5_9ACTN|nr:alpha/beta hydrolase [Streptantibioticus rubrisoli]MCQ4042117.1 alpha/beta hydrolase [Streptantibioticus rubrisoli]